MQVAHESRVIDMLDPVILESPLREIKPNFIVPEIESIHTDTLLKLEGEGFNIIPSAKAVSLTMNREDIRNFASRELGLRTSKYFFADTIQEFRKFNGKIGLPCVVKPIMSSSGKDQTGGRSGKERMIIEEFIPFDFEITLLTIRHIGGTTFIEPIGISK